MPKQQADNCVHETAKNREKKKGRLSARNRTVDSIEPPSNEPPPPSRYCAVRPSIFLAPDRLIKPGFRLRLPLERPIKALHQNARFFSFPSPPLFASHAIDGRRMSDIRGQFISTINSCPLFISGLARQIYAHLPRRRISPHLFNRVVSEH